MLTSIVLSTLTFCASAEIERGSDLGSAANAVMKPMVRVQTARATGSGTILYSEDREQSGEFQTFVLTNAHVIEGAVHVVKVWDSLRSQYRYAEQNEQVTVELFLYLRDGRTVVAQPVRADIVAHDDAEDLAVLKLDYPTQCPHVAPMLPASAPVRLLQNVLAVGCSLGVDPIATAGEVLDLEVIIERKPYLMISAPIIFGNSGGAIFVVTEDGYFFAGVPARVTVSGGGQAITTMGYAIPIDRVRRFLDEQRLRFFLDPAITPTRSLKEREGMQRVSAPPPEDQEQMGPPERDQET